jgi:ribokinase
MAEIVVLGSINMDLVVRAERMPRPGETLRGEGFTTVPGGKGANQAAAAARLGAAVEMVGRVGDDDFGPALLDNLRGQGVGTAHVTVDAESASGIAVIILDSAGENSIVVASGANGRVSLDDVAGMRRLLDDARYLVMQFEVPLPAVRAAIDLGNEVGVPVVVNAAPALVVAPDFLRGVDTLIVNESEAEALAGMAVGDVEAAQKAGAKLRATAGLPAVIVTMGAQGALLLTAEQTLHIPAHKVNVVDTTAAGDAFVGGYVAALTRGHDRVEAARYANCAGALATTVLGAQTSLPSAEQVDALYQQRPT